MPYRPGRLKLADFQRAGRDIGWNGPNKVKGMEPV